MTKLWDKGTKLDKDVESFTVGTDYILDQRLFKWDCIGSIAHAKMLCKVEVLEKHEYEKLRIELEKLIKKPIEIQVSDEDCHTAIENHLVKKLGSIGKKIHTARSRNDQVLVDLRLFSKDELYELMELVLKLSDSFFKFGQKNDIPIPGYTHMQKAMPSSTALWAGSFAESLLDDLEALKYAFRLNDQCPLGSAAGYGVSFSIDRQYTCDLLGFSKVQNNVMYVQNSRGKIELAILNALSHIMLDLNKMATDLILFSMPEFGYFVLPDEFCTGSSIMPQKKNPDVLELLRAKSGSYTSKIIEINSIITNLISGYNRDFQLIKKPFFEGIDIAEECIKISILLIENIKIDEKKCKKAMSKELFATDAVSELVREGVPFREAYQQISKNLDNFKTKSVDKTHLGAPGNLRFDKLQEKISEEITAFEDSKQKFNKTISNLMLIG